MSYRDNAPKREGDLKKGGGNSISQKLESAVKLSASATFNVARARMIEDIGDVDGENRIRQNLTHDYYARRNKTHVRRALREGIDIRPAINHALEVYFPEE